MSLHYIKLTSKKISKYLKLCKFTLTSKKFNDKVKYHGLSVNKSTHAIEILKINLNKVNWYNLSQNENAIHILENNLDKIDGYGLSLNPNAISILEKNLDKVNWSFLSANPNAIHILEKNLDKVNYEYLLINPNIFEYDYKQMELNTSIFKEELVAIALSPERICKLYSQGFTSDDL